jgi:hypothetical protein
MSEKKELGIKESLEVIAAAKLVGVNVVAAAKDGLDFSDAQYAINIAKDSEKIVEAVKDIGLVDDEVKDLSQEELLQLGMAAFDLVKSVAAANKSA